MTEKMKTVCVGRYLVDVPAQADVALSRERVAGFDIETVEEDETAFQARVAAREAEIAGRAVEDYGIGGMVEARDLRIPHMVGRTLIHGRNRGYLMEGDRRIEDEFLSVDVYAHTEGVSFTLSAKYADEARAKLAESLLARLRLRDEHEVPTDPGFCIGRALFVEPLPVHQAEHIAMHLSLPEHRDLALALVSMPGGDTDAGLLARVSETDSAASTDERLRVTKLRLGKRSINGLNGEEALERMRELNFATTYAFIWEAKGIAGDPSKSFLSLELQGGISPRPGGKPVGTSLHEDAILTLWDNISSSIRVRKPGPPPGKVSDDEPSGPKLGATMRAGEICSWTGWWRCNEGGAGMNVQGGEVQYIRKGERMPQALLLPHQTLWQKVRGIQPSIEPTEATAWTLVDKRQRRRPQGSNALALASAGMPHSEPGRNSGEMRTAVIGSYVRTGDPCPASGWWRCEEPHALDGTRWFAEGSLLPPATFQVPNGVFGKSSGPEIIQRRSAWTLMRLAEARSLSQPTTSISGSLPLDEPPALV
ncbi:MAG: T6SS immunity protein Tli4 family protein [Telluria sp.]